MRLASGRISPVPSRAITSTKERVRAILFADALHFSSLSEDQVETFSRDFLGAIADELKHSLHKPLLQKTWGDGLCFVFETLSDAGQFALELRDRIANTDWTAFGLPEQLSLRIALHAGPIFEIQDPISRRAHRAGDAARSGLCQREFRRHRGRAQNHGFPLRIYRAASFSEGLWNIPDLSRHRARLQSVGFRHSYFATCR
jgi:hypothetical protein